jgi:hypothetical protein
MSRTRTPIEELRQSIDLLPLRTRTAMLEGIRTNEIIVGAYSDRMGGVCPMLAAHRCGGRTSFISFARAWDRFSGAKRARRATERELHVLEGNLEASIAAAEGMDLAGAISDHQATARARREREAGRTGFGWLRARREHSDAERALERFEKERETESV